jgi:hypothetical protein
MGLAIGDTAPYVSLSLTIYIHIVVMAINYYVLYTIHFSTMVTNFLISFLLLPF